MAIINRKIVLASRPPGMVSENNFRLEEEEVRALEDGKVLVFDFIDRFGEAMRSLSKWVLSGKIKYRENIIEGIENAPRAFIGLFKGENTGKQLVHLSD